MEGNQEGQEKAVPGTRNYRIGYDEELIKRVGRNCGSDHAREAMAYIRTARWQSRNNFFCMTVDGVAFCTGTFGKEHFRLVEIAVQADCQHRGYGRGLLERLEAVCRQKGKKKVTLRTSKHEKAKEWWQSVGAQVIGENGDDYEMEILL